MTDATERIGHAEREAAVTALKTHLSAGRLTSAEYEERSESVKQARTRAELTAPFSDLPEPGPGDVPGPPVPGPPATTIAAPTETDPNGLTEVKDRRGGLLPEPYAATAMSLVPLIGVVLFFTTHSWLWFLAVPIAGILIYGPGGRPGSDHGERRR